MQRAKMRAKALIIVDGAFGAGKSMLVDYVESNNMTRSAVMRKYTSISHQYPVRTGISKDLEEISDSEFDRYGENNSDDRKFYSYKISVKPNGPSQRYGFFKNDLDALITNDKIDNVFVIVRDRGIVEVLRRDYEGVAKILPIYLRMDDNDFRKSLEDAGIVDPGEIKFHENRRESAWVDFAEDTRTYVYVHHDLKKARFKRKLDELIKHETEIPVNRLYVNHSADFTLPAPLVGHRQAMWEKLRKYDYNKNVFLMIEYDPSIKPIFDKIAGVIKDYGMNCVVANGSESHVNLASVGAIDMVITQDIYNPLAVTYCCKYGIAVFSEISGSFNPNVAYEIGVMDTQGKDCLILRSEGLMRVPFDIVGRAVSYRNPEEITAKVDAWLKSKALTRQVENA